MKIYLATLTFSLSLIQLITAKEDLTLFSKVLQFSEVIECSLEDPDCTKEDKIGQLDAMCLHRIIKKVGSTRDKEFKNLLKLDDTFSKKKESYRCFNKTSGDQFLKFSGTQEPETKLTAEFWLIPFQPSFDLIKPRTASLAKNLIVAIPTLFISFDLL